jgi:hypothetical protein
MDTVIGVAVDAAAALEGARVKGLYGRLRI